MLNNNLKKTLRQLAHHVLEMCKSQLVMCMNQRAASEEVARASSWQHARWVRGMPQQSSDGENVFK